MSESSNHGKQQFSDWDERGGLNLELNMLKHEKIELESKHNTELMAYEDQLIRLRSEVEKGEAVRQGLEYDLVVARKQCGVERMALEEEKGKAIKIQECFKDQIEELRRKMHILQEHFQATEFSWQDTRKALEMDLQTQNQAIENYRKELESSMLDKNNLQSVIQKQNETIQELQQDLHQSSLKNNTHIDTVRQQKSELESSREREKRLRNELEAESLRVKQLIENIEAERAAHFESKFNSEVIQLRIQDLEGSLEVEKASKAQTATELDLIKKKFEQVEMAYNKEKSIAEKLTDKLKQSEKEYSFVINQFKTEVEKKNKLITELSAKISNYEENFALMEQNLATTKKQQISTEDAHGCIVKELQGLVDNHSVSSLPVSGTYNDDIKPAMPAVLEALRHTLTDYQNKLQSTSNELENTKHICEELKEKLNASNQMIQSLHNNLQNARSEQTIADKEQHHLSTKCAEKESEIGRLQKEFGKAQDAWEKEARRALVAESEIQMTSRTFQKNKEEMLTFLHSLYQRLVAGCVLIKPQKCMLGNFTWPELCVVLQENVDTLTSDFSKANEKVSHLEQVCKSKEVLIVDLQRNHENSLDKLAKQMKAQHFTWQTKTKDLEQHYSALLGEARAKAQKYQKIAEKLKDKASISEKTKDQMAIENVHIKNAIINTERNHKSLLAACALMAGALCPLYTRSCLLAAQKTLLQEEVKSCVDIQKEIRNLVQALSENGNKKMDNSWKKAEPMKLLFRKGVIVVLAAKRLQRLGESRKSAFTWVEKGKRRPGISVCPRIVQTTQKTKSHDGPMHCNEVVKWLTNTDLLSAVVTSMSELLRLLNNRDLNCTSEVQIINAATNCFSKLIKKLNVEMEYRTVAFDRHSIYIDSDSLAYRLACGLHKIIGQTPVVGLTSTTPVKECIAALRNQILGFTARLHTAEVERLSMRRELLDMKEKFRECGKNADKAQKLEEDDQLFKQSESVDPHEKLRTVFKELSNALLREDEARKLLHEQSQQLLDLNYKIQLLSKEGAEKDQTLAKTFKNLSEAKMDVMRKVQYLCQQNLWIAKLEQGKCQLEESIASAEGALRAAARDKEMLVSYMKSVSAAFQKIRDEASISRATSTQHDAPIQLPKLTPNMFQMEESTERTEFAICQVMIRNFLDVYQIACTKAAALERKITFNEKHISTLKSELQSACLREDKDLFLETFGASMAMSSAEFSENRTMPDFLPLEPEPDLSTSHQNYIYMKSFHSIKDYSSLMDWTSTYMKELPKP